MTLRFVRHSDVKFFAFYAIINFYTFPINCETVVHFSMLFIAAQNVCLNAMDDKMECARTWMQWSNYWIFNFRSRKWKTLAHLLFKIFAEYCLSCDAQLFYYRYIRITWLPMGRVHCSPSATSIKYFVVNGNGSCKIWSLFSNEIDRNAHTTSNRHFQSMIYSIIWFMVDSVPGVQYAHLMRRTMRTSP